MHPSFDPDSSSDAETIVYSPLSQASTRASSAVFIVKTLAAGGEIKYRAQCDPSATLAVLRDTLHNDEDIIMSADERFHQEGFRIGKSAETHIQWRDILQDNVIGILSKDLSTTSTERKLSPLPPATVPLHRLTKKGSTNAAQLYGNFANERDGYSYSGLWKYGGIVCRIWEKQESGMVPLRRLYSPKLNTYVFFANDEASDWWIEKEQARVEFTVGYVYRHDAPCPEGAVPLYGVQDTRIGRLLTLSESERDSCLQLGARSLEIQCYVAPP